MTFRGPISSGHPPPLRTPDDFLDWLADNLANGLLTTFNPPLGHFVDFKNPPTVWRSPEFIFPNLLANDQAGSFPLPFVYYEWLHPPTPPAPTFWLAPNLPILDAIGLPVVNIPFRYFEFSHPPQPPASSDWQLRYPNLVLNAPATQIVFGGASFVSHPPFIPHAPEWVLINNTINIREEITPAAQFIDFPHPPVSYRVQDFVFQNYLPGLRTQPALSFNFVPEDFYRHPPAPLKGPEPIFPNLVVVQAPVAPIPFTYYEWRHPPTPQRTVDAQPPNLLFYEFDVPIGATQNASNPQPAQGHPEWLAPNLVLTLFGISVVFPASVYWDDHVPTPSHPPETVFPNNAKQLSALPNVAPVGATLNRDAPPFVHGSYEWIAKNLALLTPAPTATNPFIYFEFSHPPAVKSAESLQSQNQLPYTTTPPTARPFTYFEFSHPTSPHPIEWSWANLTLSMAQNPPAPPFIYVEARVPPIVPRGPEYVWQNQTLRMSFLPRTTPFSFYDFAIHPAYRPPAETVLFPDLALYHAPPAPPSGHVNEWLARARRRGRR